MMGREVIQQSMSGGLRGISFSKSGTEEQFNTFVTLQVYPVREHYIIAFETDLCYNHFAESKTRKRR